MEARAASVLVVDDEPDIRELVLFNLRAAGFGATAVGTAAEALEALATARPDVLVLDLMLPDLPGVEVCRRVRENPELARVGILMLTARGAEYDRLAGFEVGADDYVVKPFSVREIVHRVRALARRAGAQVEAQAESYAWRGIALDAASHRVTVDGAEIGLRPLEFRVLKLLMSRKDEVLTRSQLLEQAWGITGEIHTRTVDTHMRRLREALGRYGDAIETVRGFGYRLRPEK